MGSAVGSILNRYVMSANPGVVAMNSVSIAYPIAMTVFLLLRVRRTGCRMKELLGGSVSKFWLLSTIAGGVAFTVLREMLFDLDQSILFASLDSFSKTSILVQALLLSPVFEELYFRRLLLSTICSRMGVWQGVVLSSFVFAVYHGLSGLPPHFSGSVFCLGMIAGLLMLESRSIISSVAFHISVNVANYVAIVYQS